MILLSKPNGERVAVNAQFIESAEAASDTVVTLVDGTSYLVTESVPEIAARVRMFRASLLANKRPPSGARVLAL
jgi:flagellar protein FlbD